MAGLTGVPEVQWLEPSKSGPRTLSCNVMTSASQLACYTSYTSTEGNCIIISVFPTIK